jgi:hypothetical protein
MLQIYRCVGHHIRVLATTPISGTAITKDTAPMIGGGLSLHENIAAMNIEINSVFVNQLPVNQGGIALTAYGIRFLANNSTRCIITSASVWIDLVNAGTAAAPVGAILAQDNPNYLLSFNPVVVLPAGNFVHTFYFFNCLNVRITATALALRYLMRGIVTGFIGIQLPASQNILERIHRVNPESGTVTSHPVGIAQDVYIWRNKVLLGAA